MKHFLFSILGLAAAALGGPARAADLSEEDELAMAFGDKSFVSVATGSRVPVARAPSVATVITAEDIRAMGAADLDEVLQTVPGLHVSRSPVLNAPIYTFRGVRGTLTNPHVLMLVDGVPQTRVYAGDRGLNWGGQPLHNVARIEVIRGPGSALYGADAYSGVISIQTKRAADIAGTELGVRAGSFDTAGAWVVHGGRWSNIDVAAYLAYASTDGGGRTITADGQTGLDAIFGAFGVPPASRAPGPMNNGYKLVDAALDLGTDHWRFRTSYKRVNELQTGAGVAQALDPAGRNTSQRIDADLSWSDAPSPGLELMLRAYASRYDESSHLVLFPAGTNLGLGFFEDGMIGAPAKWERQARLEATATYTGLAEHRLRFGAGHANLNMYRLHERKNFNPDFSPIGSGSLADVTDVTQTVPFMRPHERNVTHVYLQDEWSIANDWALTAGVRHDHYSDFGGTTNPRVALVWDASYDITAKLLYGTAFRAPAFSELYLINNPTAIGNPHLSPERMRTLEAAASWQAASNARLGLNVFRYWLSDLITPDTTLAYQNKGEQTGHGAELEAEWEPDRNLRLAAHYAFQRATDGQTDQDPGMSPRQRGYLRLDWQPVRGWHADVQANWVAGRERQAGDTRAPLADYSTADLTLRTQTADGSWRLALTASNLFGADAREPSPVGTPFVSIPNDLPRAGRAVFVTLACRL